MCQNVCFLLLWCKFLEKFEDYIKRFLISPCKPCNIHDHYFNKICKHKRIIYRGWLGVAKVSCILCHWGVQLRLTYSWARPAICVAGKGRGGMFLFLLFLHFHSYSSLPCPSLSSLLSLFSLSLGGNTKWPTRADVLLNPNSINGFSIVRQFKCTSTMTVQTSLGNVYLKFTRTTQIHFHNVNSNKLRQCNFACSGQF